MAGGWVLGRRPGLDGIRAIAVILVFVAHGQVTIGDHLTVAGSVGVAIFFALSGFLISSILLEGEAFVPFYRNRALRLLPAMVVYVLLVGAVEQLATGAPMVRLWPAATYLGNWMGSPGQGMTHLWSLAVEEQFYMVWPVALALVRRWRNGPLLVCLAGMAGSLLLKLSLWDGGAGAARLYAGSDTQAWALLSGCLLAVLAHRGLRAVTVSWLGLGVLTGAAAALVVSGGPMSNAMVVPLVVPPVSALVVWAACSSRDVVLAAPVLRYVGRRSYALYLWHPVAIGLAMSVVGRDPLALVVGAAATLLAGEASWRLVEAPFLRLKSRRTTLPAPTPAPTPAPVAEPVPTAVVSALPRLEVQGAA